MQSISGHSVLPTHIVSTVSTVVQLALLVPTTNRPLSAGNGCYFKTSPSGTVAVCSGSRGLVGTAVVARGRVYHSDGNRPVVDRHISQGRVQDFLRLLGANGMGSHVLELSRKARFRLQIKEGRL